LLERLSQVVNSSLQLRYAISGQEEHVLVLLLLEVELDKNGPLGAAEDVAYDPTPRA